MFLHVPQDPTIVYYKLCIPNLDYAADDENGLHRTAVAQVFAFILRALASEPPDQAWHDAAQQRLGLWEVEYIDILKEIPETERYVKESPGYIPGKWKGFVRSPIRTRSSCMPLSTRRFSQDETSDDEHGHPPPTPTPTQGRQTRSRTTQASTSAGGRQQAAPESGSGRGNEAQRKRRTKSTAEERKPVITKVPIRKRAYCTQQCLLGLSHGGQMDKDCPNIHNHKKRHPKKQTFLRLVRQQLAIDRGGDADCMPMYVKGARGALFKVRLSSHGYTFVAKGMEEHNTQHLGYEEDIYGRCREPSFRSA